MLISGITSSTYQRMKSSAVFLLVGAGILSLMLLVILVIAVYFTYFSDQTDALSGKTSSQTGTKSSATGTTTHLADGSIETKYTDGSVETTYPDGGSSWVAGGANDSGGAVPDDPTRTGPPVTGGDYSPPPVDPVSVVEMR